MDFQLTHFYRQVCEDALLIIDVIRINPSLKPVKESWLECFTEALTLVVQVEAMELVPNLSNPEMSSKVENVDLFTGTSNNKFLTGIFFEFCHSILLQFVAEELSQYPFWAAKVALCTIPLEDPPLTAFLGLLRDKYRGGLTALFQGSAPYLVACYLSNIATVELSLRRFLAIVLSGIPRSPSMQTKIPLSPPNTNSSSHNPKYRRDFLYQNKEDPTRHLETFNNTGLNASSSDGQLTQKQMQSKGLRNVRSSIIRENNSSVKNNNEWEGSHLGSVKGDRVCGENFSSVTSPRNSDSIKSHENNGTPVTIRENVKKEEDSCLEADRRPYRQNSVGGKLNNIWALSGVNRTEKENINGKGNMNGDEYVKDNQEMSDTEMVSLGPPLLRGFSTTSSSNTIHIGLNIGISNSDQSLSSIGLTREDSLRVDGDERSGVNVEPNNLLPIEVEDDIDNDEDETDDVFAVDGDILYQTSLTRRYPSTGSACSAGSCDSRSSGNSSTESINDSDTDNGSVCTDSKSTSSSSVHSSSRLLSSNPSFPARSPYFSSNPSLSFSSSFPSFPSARPSMGSLQGKSEKEKPKPECYFSSPGILQKICIVALAHPFLVLSVKMVTNPELRYQNWIYSYVHIVSRSGLGGLYSGIRAALGSVLIPFPLSFLFGMPETVIYRCMLDQGIVDEGSPSVGILSAVTSAVVVHKVSSQEGIYGMLRYGILSAMQVAPGLCSFVLARSVLWMVLGNTKARRRQYLRRKEILEEHWRDWRGQRGYVRPASFSNIGGPGPVSSPVRTNSNFFKAAASMPSPPSSTSSLAPSLRTSANSSPSISPRLPVLPGRQYR